MIESNEIHRKALKRFDQAQSAQYADRTQALQDRRFYSIAGAQWEGNLAEQFENKPKFEVNKVHLAVIRIISEYKNNPVTVSFTAKDGSPSSQTADTCAGLYRADEKDSNAIEAYDNAFEEGVGGGFGAWRLTCDYEDEEGDEEEEKRQRIRIEPITDADSSVYFDMNSKRQDKADAQWAIVLTSMTPDHYEDVYDDSPKTWPKEVMQFEFDWATPDVVYVAEYYTVEMKSETVRVFRGINDVEVMHSEDDFKEDPTLEEVLQATGFREIRQKKVKERKIHKYIMSGGGILEDCGYIAGKHIPIVPFYGKRWFVDNVERFMGHVRLAKDAQMLKNMQLSKIAMIAAMSIVEKPIVTPSQMAGNALMWAEDNIKDYPYLLLNNTEDSQGNPIPAAPAAYTRAPNIPPAMAALLQITETDMQDILGNAQAGEELQPNMSGKAVELVQNRLDMQTFIYMANFKKAQQRSGVIWLEMAKEIYPEEGRKMKIIDAKGKTSSVELMRPIMGEDGSIEYENDLTEADFDVDVDVGPSFASKRAATVRSLIGMMQATSDPETIQVLSAMAMMNMEGEGLSDVHDYFRNKLLRMGAVKPTKEEQEMLAQEAQNQKSDPNTEYLQAAAREADAKAAGARADTVLTIAKAEETRAKTIETLTSIDREDRMQVQQEMQTQQQQQIQQVGPSATQPMS